MQILSWEEVYLSVQYARVWSLQEKVLRRGFGDLPSTYMDFGTAISLETIYMFLGR